MAVTTTAIGSTMLLSSQQQHPLLQPRQKSHLGLHTLDVTFTGQIVSTIDFGQLTGVGALQYFACWIAHFAIPTSVPRFPWLVKFLISNEASKMFTSFWLGRRACQTFQALTVISLVTSAVLKRCSDDELVALMHF